MKTFIYKVLSKWKIYKTSNQHKNYLSNVQNQILISQKHILNQLYVKKSQVNIRKAHRALKKDLSNIIYFYIIYYYIDWIRTIKMLKMQLEIFSIKSKDQNKISKRSKIKLCKKQKIIAKFNKLKNLLIKTQFKK